MASREQWETELHWSFWQRAKNNTRVSKLRDQLYTIPWTLKAKGLL